MFTVVLNTNRTERYYPCSCEADMQILKSALSLKFGDLQVTVRTQPAANQPHVDPGLTDLEKANRVQARKAKTAYRRASRGR